MTGHAAAMPPPGPLPRRLSYGCARESPVAEPAGNFLYFAMRRWPNCRVHWLVDVKIDSPEQWLPEDEWKSLARRFTIGSRWNRRPG